MSAETITLFGFSRGKIRQLLKTTDSFGHYSEYLEDKCKGTFGKHNLTISIAHANHNGLADLLLTMVEHKGNLVEAKTECVEKSESRNTKKLELIFNGLEYVDSSLEQKP